jgi:dTDP-4-dehydrorhamnose reductase
MTNIVQVSTPLILLLGANGQVGWELRRSLSLLGTVVALDRNSQNYCGNLEDTNGIQATIQTLKPQVVVNAAAYTAVDKAEQDYDKAYVINALAVAAMAQSCQEVNALLVHYSTDYVFDGSGSQARLETDSTQAVNLYGLSKLEGEQLIQRYCNNYLIFRTSWVYASKGANFAKTMLRLAQEKSELKVINDQIGAPTGADLIADVSAHAIVQTLQNSKLTGLYHLVASGSCSWFDYTVLVLKTAEQLGQKLTVRHDQVQAIPSSAYPTIAKRPLNSRLSHELIEATFHLSMPAWQVGVERLVNELNC